MHHVDFDGAIGGDEVGFVGHRGVEGIGPRRFEVDGVGEHEASCVIERVGGQDVLDFVVCRFGDVGVNRLASFFVIDDEIDRFDGGGVIILSAFA